MSEHEHTKGPWGLSNSAQSHYEDEIYGPHGLDLIADFCVSDNNSLNQANARHAVACVNALEGLNPEGVAGMVEFVKSVAALKGVAVATMDEGVELLADAAKNALQKAGVEV